MKKIISILIFCAMLTALVPFAVSADGSILWTEDFNSGVINEADWYPGAFTCESGGPTNTPHVEDWAGWHVLQSMYNNENGGNRTFGANVCFKVDGWAMDDGGNDASEHKIGLWWADYFAEAEGDGRIVYTYIVNYETRKATLIAAGEGDGEAYYEAGVYSAGTTVGEWAIPEDQSFEMDLSDPSVVSLGMRINGAQIDCFFNDIKAISFTAPRMGGEKSPILLVNDGCYAGFDNFVVATADYDLFNEGAAMNEPAPAQTEAPAGDAAAPAGDDAAAEAPAATEKVIEKENVVVGTDADGSAVTEVVTKEVARPAANTGAKTTGGNAAKTGDSAVIVAAIMIVALGSAVVVFKIRTSK